MTHEAYWKEKKYTNYLLNLLPTAIFWKNTDGVFIGCNKRFAEISGLNSPDEIVGKTDYDMPWGEIQASLYRKDDHEIMLNGTSKSNIEETLTLANGTELCLLTNKVPLFSDEGEIMGILGIFYDITERKKMELSIKKAKEAAESANRAKTEFIANMSHDIRTPLTGVIGLAEILEHTLQHPEEKEKIQMLHESGKELLHMLNDILDDIRVGNLNESDIKKESFNLHQCIADLVRLESPATTLKGLSLKVDIKNSVPQYIQSDRNKIHRILLNLMGNAIKFTQAGDISLCVDCTHYDEKEVHLKFSVSDTGIGIPEEAQAQVFKRFFKVNSSYKGLYEGHGLGLHIAQSYVELLGGHITLFSTVGVGTTFHFDIICAPGKAPLPSTSILSSCQPSAQTRHLLLVEDHLVALKTLEFLLKQKGYTFASAASGEEAWMLLQNQTFDAMITDIGLPGISGTQLSQRLRSQEMMLHKPPLPIIGLTGHAKEAALDECLQHGMNEVFSKPASMDTLHPCIQKLTQKRHATNLDATDSLAKKSFLGIDLPGTEEELFQLDAFPLFDEAYVLNQIGDKQLLITLIQAYLSEDMQNDITLMQEQYKKGRWEEVEKIAHKIKGGVAYLGTQKMRYACQYLERYYKAGHRKLLEPLYQQILQVNHQTNEVLTAWLTGLN
ncbi:MAG: hybrid sensor histidine kinase/response regulator [Legionella sp.]|nr:MAG: hybrid sensor histidine kinase/response regulator [Legionella sp.]PJD99014.1 MAG: hybrid sensor histidine kinase/response regulator [Legionella sp.]